MSRCSSRKFEAKSITSSGKSTAEARSGWLRPPLSWKRWATREASANSPTPRRSKSSAAAKSSTSTTTKSPRPGAWSRTFCWKTATRSSSANFKEIMPGQNTQSQPTATVARRPLDLADYLELLRRHKGRIIGSVFAALVVSVVAAFFLPDTYVSIATIRVVPPQVPESFVPANVNMDVQGRVNSLIQLILNRAALANIIVTHNLYPKDRRRIPLDDVIENMRLYDIKCCPLLAAANAPRSD